METVKKKIAQLKSMRDKAVNEANEFENELAWKMTKAEELETRLPKYNSQLSDLEDGLDAAESKLVELHAKQYESEKRIHEGSQAQKLLENRKQRDEQYIRKLNEELNELKERNTSDGIAIRKLEDENQTKEDTVEKSELRSEELTYRAKQLEGKMNDLGNALRLMELNEIESHGRKTVVEKKIEELNKSLKDINGVVAEFEHKSSDLTEAVDEKENELVKVKENYIKSQHEFQTLVAEIGEM